MKAARIVYIGLLLITVLPLIGFNLKRIFIRKEGEKKRLSIPRAGLLAAGAVALTIFILSMYSYTLTHQPQLLTEQYATGLFTNANSGSAEMLQKQTQDIVYGQPAEQETFPELFAKLKEYSITRYQIGEYIRPKYFSGNELFPEVAEADKAPEQSLYLFVRVEDSQGKDGRYNLIVRLLMTDDGWRICSVNSVSADLLAFAEENKLIKGENSYQWINIEE